MQGDRFGGVTIPSLPPLMLSKPGVGRVSLKGQIVLEAEG